ncbi:RND family efflux transporter, MFP subunit [Neptunomonas qingdaonensis]|uniref:RND family efflux transporter, MFP subunit n=2 Tax=Neptunomonas qingdaonensis TaxID=1045558 RepID=A0A1I2MCS5_9GAMM|nr:RND family efflux transporter, MFP subunit [Neptunomonas qingdaonensis]
MDCTRGIGHHLSALLMLSMLLPSIALGDSSGTPARNLSHMPSYMPSHMPANTLEPLDCVINPSIVADLGSSIPGVLSTVLVDRSDFIKSGEIVATLESGVNTAALELARTRAALTAEIDLRRLNTAFGQRQYKRVEDLFSKKVISSKDMDQTETELKLTRLQLRQARDNQKLAQLEVARAQEVLEQHSIRSPISGVIMDRFKTVGEYIDDQPVVRVAQLSPLHVEVIVPVQQLGKIQKGMMADVWSDAVGGKWQAKVSRVDRVADVASGTYGVRLTLDNPDYKIPAGLRCRINFIPEEDTTPLQPIADDEAGQVSNLKLETAAPEQTEEKVEPAAAEETAAVIETETAVPLETVAKTETAPQEETVAQIQADTHPEATECAWLGPYNDKATANQKATTIQVEGIDISVQSLPDNQPTGIKVLSPPFDTKKEANAYLSKLRSLGDKDHFLIRSQKNEPHQVSLGLYSATDSAELRASRLKKKGFDVVLEPRYTQHHWLLINGDLSQLGSNTLQAIADTATLAPSISCNTTASL